jgi:hypothetical protein
MLDMQDHKLVALDGEENGISKSPEVPTANARMLRLLNQIGIFKKLRNCVVDALGKISDDRRGNFEKIGMIASSSSAAGSV